MRIYTKPFQKTTEGGGFTALIEILSLLCSLNVYLGNWVLLGICRVDLGQYHWWMCCVRHRLPHSLPSCTSPWGKFLAAEGED